MNSTILVAGIGNIFLGDDAFGVEVARALLARPPIDGVAVKDFGIRGFDLAYALLDPWDTVILVDALPRGQAPGTLYTIQPNLDDIGNLASPAAALDPHGMDPVRVLHVAASIGNIAARILVVGCEPHDFGDEFEGRMGLSPPVGAAIGEACNMVRELATGILLEKAQKPEPKLCTA
jgi:hydrogenase maturation protease